MGKVNYLPYNFPDIPENQKPTAETREILYDLLRTHRYGPFGRSEEPVKTKAKFEALLNHLEDEDGPKVICGTSNNLIHEQEKAVTTAQIRPSNENIKNQERVSALALHLGVDASSLTSNEKGVRLEIENDGACLFRAILFLRYGNKAYLTCPKKDLLLPRNLDVVKELIFSAFNTMKKMKLERPVEYKDLSEDEMATIIWENFHKNQEFTLYAPSPLIGILQNRSNENATNENAKLAQLTDSKFDNISTSALHEMLTSSSDKREKYIENFCDIFCGELSKAFNVSTKALKFEPYLDLENHHYNVQYPPDYVTSVTNKDRNHFSYL